MSDRTDSQTLKAPDSKTLKAPTSNVEPLDGAADAVPSAEPERSSPRRLVPKLSMSALEVGQVIGEGAMGIVRSAVQVSLGRAVAIKSVRRGASVDAVSLVLREAWVTGYLEHPGVVPVHDIVSAPDGVPVVVMRKVDGITWEQRRAASDSPDWGGAVDAIEGDLRILLRVAEIVEFAHAKGVLHRDIKPANVMLGAFGEVYLLDWGLAAALSDEVAAHLPRADQQRGMAGTVGYAAPEMMGVLDEPLSAASDVYLLGAILYEIICGAAPHTRPTMRQALASIGASPPPMPPQTPPRIASLCERAMQLHPQSRHQTAAAFRHDVVKLLQSRECDRLLLAAQSTLARLVEACAKDETRSRIYDLFGECRFAFQAASRSDADDARAKRGLAVAASLLVEYELTREPRVALALLDEWRTVEPGLAAKVRAAAEAEAKELAKLSRVNEDHNPRVGRRTRIGTFIFFGVLWSITSLSGDQLGPPTPVRFAIGTALELPLIALAYALLTPLRSSRFNRRIVGSVVLVVIFQVGLYLTGPLLNLPLVALRTLQIAIWALMASALTLLVDRRLVAMSAALVAAYIVAVLFPSWRAVAASASMLGVAANMALVWWRRDRSAS